MNSKVIAALLKSPKLKTIIHNQEFLKGKKLIYEKGVPGVEHQGILEGIEIDRGMIKIIWNCHGQKLYSKNRPEDLVIDVDSKTKSIALGRITISLIEEGK